MPRDFGASGDISVSRRNFLRAGAAFGGGVMIGWVPEVQSAADPEQAVPNPNAFIRLDRQGKVTIVSPMAEMGQGTDTSLPMLVAEELDVEMSSIAVEHAQPDDKLYGNPFLGGAQITGNSASIRGFYLPLRQIGAAARAMLMTAAANKLGVDPDTLKTEPGHVVDATGQRIA